MQQSFKTLSDLIHLEVVVTSHARKNYFCFQVPSSDSCLSKLSVSNITKVSDLVIYTSSLDPDMLLILPGGDLITGIFVIKHSSCVASVSKFTYYPFHSLGGSSLSILQGPCLHSNEQDLLVLMFSTGNLTPCLGFCNTNPSYVAFKNSAIILKPSFICSPSAPYYQLPPKARGSFQMLKCFAMGPGPRY